MGTLTEVVDLSTEREQHWPTVGGYGVVPIGSVIPSPYNPRKHFDAREIESLAESVLVGGQREIATVRELTQNEKDEHPGVRYMLTSGERRWRAACRAGKETFEIRVKAYASRAEERRDAYILNENRVGLSDLENAWAVRDIALDFGWETQSEIAAGINKDPVWVSQTLALLKCSKKVQARMHPRVKKDDRLSKQVGAFLSRVPDEVQDDLSDRMPLSLTTATGQLAWLRGELKEAGVELPRHKRNPQKIRRLLRVLAQTVGTKARDMNEDPSLRRLFENTNDDDAKELAVQMRTALIEFERLVERVEELSRGEKKQTMLVRSNPRVQVTWRVRTPENSAPAREQVVEKPLAELSVRTSDASERKFAEAAARLLALRAQKGKEERRSAKSAPVTQLAHPKGKAFAEAEDLSPAEAPSAAPPPTRKPRFVFVSLWDDGVLRFVGRSVSIEEYCRLWDQGLLRFQKEGGEKPEHYPDRSEVSG